MSTVSSPLSVGRGGGQVSVPDFEKGGSEKKRERRGVVVGLKSSCHKYLPGGITMFLVKKAFVK